MRKTKEGGTITGKREKPINLLEKTRNKRQFYCKVNFTTDKGRFHSGEKGWGVEQALSKSLKEIERQIEKRLGKRIHRTPRKGLFPSRIK